MIAYSEKDAQGGLILTLRSVVSQNNGSEVALGILIECGEKREERRLILSVDQYLKEKPQKGEMSEELFERSPLELSGGQKRRIAIAGVMAMRPGVLILDEPTAGLDPSGCAQIMENICTYREKTGATVLIVSHNMDDAASFTERLLVFDHGSLAMDGSPDEIFGRAEELCEMGLAVPRATAIAMELRRKGVALDGAVYTHEQLLAAILRAKEVR